jgi:hypothetical protein
MALYPTDSIRGRAARAVMAGLTAALLIFAPATAWAHGDDESERAFDLVRQAIALIVNTPDDTMAIADKIDDAIGSGDTSDVRIPLVEQARDALAAGDVHKARALLEQSIGARVHTSGADPVAVGHAPPPITGAGTGTVAAIDALPGRGGLRGGEWALLAVCVAVALAGVTLSIRLRPHLPHVTTHGEVAR